MWFAFSQGLGGGNAVFICDSVPFGQKKIYLFYRPSRAHTIRKQSVSCLPYTLTELLTDLEDGPLFTWQV